MDSFSLYRTDVKYKSTEPALPVRRFKFSFKLFFLRFRLTAQAESLDDGTVAVDVALVQIVQKAAALADEDCQRTLCYVILVVLLEVLRQVGNTV